MRLAAWILAAVLTSPVHARGGEGKGEGPADDVARAFAAARARGALVLVDVWAPW